MREFSRFVFFQLAPCGNAAPVDIRLCFCDAKAMNEIKINGKLVDAQELLSQLFSDGCRPSLRWLRTQTAAKAIPHVRIGHLVFFDVEMVRAHLTERRLLRSRCLPMRLGVGTA